MSSNNKYTFINEVPLLEQEKIQDISSEPRNNSKKGFHRLRKMYLILVFFSIFLLTAVLLIWAVGRGEINLSNGFWDELSKDFLESFFQKDKFENNDHYENPSEPDAPADIPTNSTVPDGDNKEDHEQEKDDTVNTIYDFDYSKVPKGDKAIIPLDLSCISLGEQYINNSTGYTPDINSLLNASFSTGELFEQISNVNEPQVLIIHTHATEAYSADKSISYTENGGELARSYNEEENVISLGEIMTNIFNKNGIYTIHCKVAHDYPQYKDSYLRAEKTVMEYLEKYPSIKLVIDLHRDAIFNDSNEMVRPVVLVDGEETAQIMCVVGSDWGGNNCANWEDNLSLALKIRKNLNDKYFNICRPVDLRSATYNQELSRYSLLLEIGSCGNSLEEARRATVLVSNALAEILKKIPK